jgi:serine/threonine protein kinase
MKRIGKYIVRGLLGRGGMSKVYKVEIPRIGKIVALKLLDPHPVITRVLGEEKIRELFFSEAVKLARLNHPNIVAIRDFDEADGRPFYLMDYFFSNLGLLIGETRCAEAHTRTIRMDRAIDLIRQTLEGLACLHHHGFVHRDIKPYNLMLDDQNTVKICDFGLSTMRGERVAMPQHLKVGSPGYAAPEQEQDPDSADSRADLYAVGVTLYRMLIGSLPADPPLAPGSLNPDLDEAWNEFILRGIARDPERRFASAVDMLRSLDALDREWQARRDRTCLLASAVPPAVSPAPPRPASLRQVPVKINPAQAKAEFGVDALWRPSTFVQNRFTMPAQETVHDTATGLVWQKSGSPYPVSWQESHAYVAGLNRSAFGGRRCWRLPSTPELMSLLTPIPHGADFCIEPVFDYRQKTLWSADRRSFTAAWWVSIDMGFVAWQDFSAGCYVRAVCSYA